MNWNDDDANHGQTVKVCDSNGNSNDIEMQARLKNYNTICYRVMLQRQDTTEGFTKFNSLILLFSARLHFPFN